MLAGTLLGYLGDSHQDLAGCLASIAQFPFSYTSRFCARIHHPSLAHHDTLLAMSLQVGLAVTEYIIHITSDQRVEIAGVVLVVAAALSCEYILFLSIFVPVTWL